MPSTTRKCLVFALLAVPLFCASCGTVPITGRRQLALVPDSELTALSLQSYKDFISKNKVGGSASQRQMVMKVGPRVQKAVEHYFGTHGMAERLGGYQWEFNLVDGSQVNAFCMPGGKVVVYTGLFTVAKGEADLAVVLGHEIAHAVANHGNERMSYGLLQQMGGKALSEALSSKPAETQGLFMGLYGVGTQIGVLLPYSRMQESEADRLGLIFMAMAGYDPNSAVSFWQKMAKTGDGAKTTELLSTHPSDDRRISQIRTWVPEAMTYYQKP